jgi:hypothetical protein
MTGRISALFLLALAAPLPAQATTVIVPDDFPTIQQAIDSGADEVQVKEGDYPEDLRITRVLRLVPAPWTNPAPHLAVPTVRSLEVSGPTNFDLPFISGFHVTGACRPAGTACFEACQFDSGLHALPMTADFNFLYMRGCVVHGEVIVHAYSSELVGNTIIAGGLWVWAEGYSIISHNYIVGPAEKGIDVSGGAAGFNIVGNHVVGTRIGITRAFTNGTFLTGNVVERCSETGYLLGTRASAVCRHNTARDCGGDGFYMTPYGITALDSNLVVNAGQVGFHIAVGFLASFQGNTVRRAGAQGVFFDNANVSLFSHNAVVHARSDGIVVNDNGERIESNVTGHCGGRGLVVIQESATHVYLFNNTSYLNHDAGFYIQSGHYWRDTSTDSIAGNIAFANGTFGLDWHGEREPHIACNDWCGNPKGAISGVPIGASDLTVDPDLCNPTADDAFLREGSPLLDAPGCGLIGALGMGCTGPVGVVPVQAQSRFAMTVSPVPASGAIRFSWAATSATTALSIFDVSGARVWEAKLDRGTTGVEWKAVDRVGHRVPPGVYYAEVRSAGQIARGRAVIGR